MAKILGLDLGTNSIGWAITEQQDDNYILLDKGVDIFQEGVARTKSGEEPMVKTRTDARALRRHYYRRRLRKIELLKVLIANDFCPYLDKEQLDNWRYKKEYPLTEEFTLWLRSSDSSNPYADRYKALTEQLNLSVTTDRFTLGRALYHLAQRRGFLSIRKDSLSDEDGKVVGSIKRLDEDMRAANCTYLGEFYYRLYLSGMKIRTGDGYGYAGRVAHYEKEFNAICDKQQLSDDLREALHRAIFFQRPLKSQKGLVGTCTFEKGKARCPISHPRFEEYRMLSFINNIKIKTPSDVSLRTLNDDEISMILPLFFRKRKEYFDFEDIAKKLAGGKKHTYGYIDCKEDVTYRFNYKMSQTVSGSPVTTALRTLFGEDWLNTMCSLYVKGVGKSEEQILNDVWHARFSFNDDDRLACWARENLQLNDEQAEEFVNIPMKQGYAALSLNAINKILPYLRTGYRYDEAVYIANLERVVPASMWSDTQKREDIIDDVCSTIVDYSENHKMYNCTKKQAIDNMLLDNYGISLEKSARLYEPSRVETYAKAQPNANGKIRLGSPRTSSVRNPMAMRALFRLRALVNKLLDDGKIDPKTKINIEFARGLNDANVRAAIERYQRENAARHSKYAEEIKSIYKEECGKDITPSSDDILKYQLWKEQNFQCLYTGENIGICDFVGANPRFDIEHTVPRSRGGDNSQQNKTLCECDFNRRVKREKLPADLANHAEIIARIETLGWAKEIEKLETQIEICNRRAKSATTKEAKDRAIQDRHYLRMKLDYLRGKFKRFTMTEVSEGFSNRQGVDIGIIGRYAKLYLETVFHRVFTVKGATTAAFRKMWGLQEEYAKKERINHIHHCIDAVTIACIGSGAYAKWAQYQRDEERYYWDKNKQPDIEKPWATFTEDVKSLVDNLLVSHHTANKLPKHSRKILRVRGKVQRNANGEALYAQGDTARASLHKDTFYGVIEKDNERLFVVRKELCKESFKESDIENIVDPIVKEKVRMAVKQFGFKKIQDVSNYPIWMNEAKRVQIKKVRVYIPKTLSPIPIGNKQQRDLSKHEYKRPYYAVSDGNYCMAIYEGTDAKGKTKRSFQIVNNLEAAKFYNNKTNRYDLVPQSDSNDYPLKYILRTGTMVLFYENSSEELYECSHAELTKRLYKVTGMSSTIVQQKYRYGMMTLKYHQEARPAGELKEKKGEWKIGEEYRPVIVINHNQLNALVEGYDFEITVTGEIKFKH